MKTLLIIQPGRIGDIIICLPIARWYSQEYEVLWECPVEYHAMFRNIPYCRPIATANLNPDKVIDLGFGLRKKSEVHQWWIKNRASFSSFVYAKYQLADVPIEERWKLVWDRNTLRENALYDRIVSEKGSQYSIAHEKTHDDSIYIHVANKVIFTPIADFNIFDWYRVLMEADSIHCIDSSLCNFVESVPEFEPKRKFYYRTGKVKDDWGMTTTKNNWWKVNEC